MRRFESLLPDAPVARRISLPHVDLSPVLGFMRSRLLWVVVLVVVAISALVAWVHTDDRWFIYREDVHFNGLSYLDADELWQASELDGWQVFWIDANEVRRLLLQNPYVADAQVHISQLGAKVTVDITEHPSRLWFTRTTGVFPRGE